MIKTGPETRIWSIRVVESDQQPEPEEFSGLQANVGDTPSGVETSIRTKAAAVKTIHTFFLVAVSIGITSLRGRTR